MQPGRSHSKLAFATIADPTAGYSQFNEHELGTVMRRHFPDVVNLGPLHRRPIHQLLFGMRKALARLAGVELMNFCEPWIADHYTDQLLRKARAAEVTFVFGLPTVPLAGLAGRLRYAFWQDAPVSGLLRLGHYMDRWATRSIKQWLDFDRRATLGAEVVFYSSPWAAQCAAEDYGASFNALHVVGIGPGIEAPSSESLALDREPGSPLRLLFYGRDWRRKGGDIAVDVVAELNRQGAAAHLTVCGPATTPPEVARSDSATFVPHVRKQYDGQVRLAELLRNTDFLLLPTRADCTPNAIAEAAAFGVPSVTTDVGGVRYMVRDGEGWVLSRDASARDIASAIASAASSDIPKVRRAARAAYETRLNWDVVGRSIAHVLPLRLDSE